MEPSSELVRFVAHSEGLSLRAYWDEDGWSIGYGHHGPEVQHGQVWTKEQAELKLAEDLKTAAQAVLSLVKVNLSQGQFDALTDFVFNFGVARLKESTLLRVLNMGLYEQVPSELIRWNRSGGRIDTGLMLRRQGDIGFWNGE
jgi:lysozyme